MSEKTSVFIVRGENSGAPESTILGVYPTKELAEARCAAMEYNEGEDQDEFYEIVWFDEIVVGPQGADCSIQNR